MTEPVDHVEPVELLESEQPPTGAEIEHDEEPTPDTAQEGD